MRDIMPALFLGHGSPMNAIAQNDYTLMLRSLSSKIPVPKAILCVSAHWMTTGTHVTAMPKPRTIHDFSGFPPALSSFDYPASGSPDLAARLRDEIKFTPILMDDSKWGLDHGTWSVMTHLYPKADIPVIQLSLDLTKAFHFHFELGRCLQVFRSEGILIVGSGNIVHNLRKIDWNENATPFAWAVEFDKLVKAKIESRSFEDLLEPVTTSDSGKLSVPTVEHYLPLLYILGATRENDSITFIFEGFQNASISMRSLLVL